MSNFMRFNVRTTTQTTPPTTTCSMRIIPFVPKKWCCPVNTRVKIYRAIALQIHIYVINW